MKKISVVLLTVAVMLFLPGCKKIIEDLVPITPPNTTFPDTPTPTDVGTPVGSPATQNIGSGGGTVTSTDGKVGLEIPAGALAANTDISIQAITNNAPNGVSNAYRFSPDGLKFSKSVTLKIHYTAKDAAGTLPDLMGIAFQDSTGVWYRVNNFTNNAAGNTISAPITHFSDWTMFEAMKITPGSATIRVNGSMGLQIDYVNTGKDEDDLAPLYKQDSKPTWSVTAGTLSGTEALIRTYKAPATVPSSNPVAVSAVVSANFKYHGKTFDKTTLVADIKVYGGEEIYLLEMKIMESNWFPGIVATDSVSMKIKIQDTTVTISEITNFAWKSEPETIVIGTTTISWIPNPVEGPINILSATGDITIDFLGPDTRFLGLYFTAGGTHNPYYHKTTPPNVDEYWGGEAVDGIPGGTSINLVGGETLYERTSDVASFRLTLLQ